MVDKTELDEQTKELFTSKVDLAPMTIVLMEPIFPHTDECCICGCEVTIKVFGKNYEIPMYEGIPVPPEWTGEWGGFTACKECFDKYESGKLKTWQRFFWRQTFNMNPMFTIGYEEGKTSNDFYYCESQQKEPRTVVHGGQEKTEGKFWSNRLDDVLEYKSRDEAEKKAQSLKFNNPRVMSKKNAKAYMTRREREQIHEIAMDCQELGWDGHKNFF